VKDGLPELHEEVLVWRKNYTEVPVQALRNTKGEWRGSIELRDCMRDGWVEDAELDFTPTHWRPLPPAPVEQKEDLGTEASTTIEHRCDALRSSSASQIEQEYKNAQQWAREYYKQCELKGLEFAKAVTCFMRGFKFCQSLNSEQAVQVSDTTQDPSGNGCWSNNEPEYTDADIIKPNPDYKSPDHVRISKEGRDILNDKSKTRELVRNIESARKNSAEENGGKP
jgi:hypothetical protein